MSPPDTKQRILHAAARHFAEYGYNGTSLRKIMREANVNVAASHYHFGSKEAVFRAVIEPTIEKIQSKRRVLMKECNAMPEGSPDLIESILYAGIAPHINQARERGGIDYIRIIARYSTEPRDLTLRLYQDLFEPVRTTFVDALRRAKPQLSDEHLYRAYGFLTAIALTSLVDAGYESLSGKSPIADNLEDLIDTMVRFAAAGFRALRQQDVPQQKVAI